MTPLTVLEKARALIADPKRWTHGYFARDESGAQVCMDSPDAVCWCASGALRLTALEAPESFHEAYWALSAAACGIGIVSINDHKGHAATLAMFDRAIAAEKAKEQ